MKPTKSAAHTPTGSGSSRSSGGSASLIKRYRVIVETASQGIWVIDKDGFTTFANRALAEMLGHEQSEMLGKSLSDFVEPAFVAQARHSLRLRPDGVEQKLEFRSAPRTATRSGR